MYVNRDCQSLVDNVEVTCYEEKVMVCQNMFRSLKIKCRERQKYGNNREVYFSDRLS